MEMIKGKKGCFEATTRILTPEGYKRIVDLQVNEIVYSFVQETGALRESLITETYKHTWEETNATLLEIIHATGSIKITDNHWVLLGTEFVEAGELVVGDFLTGLNSEQYEILEIKELDPVDYTYNLEITPNNTLIAESLRVHNKGGGKKSRVAKETPNNIGSNAVAKIVDLVSEGPIKGFVNSELPGNSIYFDDTPVQNLDGSLNYDRVSVGAREGLPDQAIIPGFTQAQTEVAVATKVLQSGGGVTRTVTSGNDSARVTLKFTGGLMKQNKENGDIGGTSVSFSIYTRKDSGDVWGLVLGKTIKNKTNAAFEIDFIIPNPHKVDDDLAVDEFQVQVRRNTSDNTASNISNDFNFERITHITEVKQSYPNSAIVGIAADAESTGGAIPKRSYELFGIEVNVPNATVWTPAVYDSFGELLTNGFYTNPELWDGSFAQAAEWSNDPAWVILDLLTNERYGMGLSIGDIDIYSFMEASIYNMELVDDGKGGQEPRFTFNGVIAKQTDAYKMVQSIASTCRAQLHESGGFIKLVQDRPMPVTGVFNNSNVVDGVFDYELAEKNARPTVCDVTFNDGDDRYLPRTIRIESDQVYRDAYGYNIMSVAGQGITSEGQARRLASWTLKLSQQAGKTVKFVVGPESPYIEVGQIIEVSDDLFRDTQDNFNDYAGRLLADFNNTNNIVLDRVVDTTADVTPNYYKFIAFNRSEGTTIQERITSVTNEDSVTLENPVTLNEGDPWIIAINDSNSISEKYKVTSITEQANASEYGYAVVANIYDEARFDDATTLPTDLFGDIPSSVVAAPENIVAQKESYVDTNNSGTAFTRSRLTVTWDQIKDPTVMGYTVKWRKDNGAWDGSGILSDNSYTVDDVSPGLYEFIIKTLNKRNIESPPATYSHVIAYGDVLATNLGTPSNVRNIHSSNDSFNRSECAITWDYQPSTDNAHLDVTNETIFKDYVLEIYNWDDDHTTVNPVKSYDNFVEYDGNQTVNEFVFTRSMNRDAFNGTPQRKFKAVVRTRDSYYRVTGDALLAAQGQPTVFENVAPAIVSSTILEGFDGISFNIDASAEQDVTGYIVVASSTLTGLTTNSANIVAKGDSTTFTIDLPGENFYAVAAYDSFVTAFNDADISSLNWNTFGNQKYSKAALDVDFEETDFQFTELVFGVNGSNIEWTAGTGTKVTAGTPDTKIINAGSKAFVGSVDYFYYNHINGTINSTQSLAAAVGTDKQILGTAKIENLGAGNKVVWTQGGALGDAFTDGGRILANTIGANQLVTDSAIITGTAQIANAVITSAAIQDLAVTNGKIANLAVDEGKIKNASISNAKIANLAVTNGKIANLAVTEGKIANLAVDSAKIKDAAIIGAKIGELEVDTLHIKNAAVTRFEIQKYPPAQLANIPSAWTTLYEIPYLTAPDHPDYAIEVAADITKTSGLRYSHNNYEKSYKNSTHTSTVEIRYTWKKADGTIISQIAYTAAQVTRRAWTTTSAGRYRQSKYNLGVGANVGVGEAPAFDYEDTNVLANTPMRLTIEMRKINTNSGAVNITSLMTGEIRLRLRGYRR